ERSGNGPDPAQTASPARQQARRTGDRLAPAGHTGLSMATSYRGTCGFAATGAWSGREARSPPAGRRGSLDRQVLFESFEPLQQGGILRLQPVNLGLQLVIGGLAFGMLLLNRRNRHSREAAFREAVRAFHA